MQRHSDHQSSTTVAPFPKIVALCGADTALGQNLLHDLLHSEQVEKVHAIAMESIPLLDELSSSTLRKARVTIIKPDRIDKALSRIVECDIAFCVSTTERHGSSSMSSSSFNAINYDIPETFVRKMFELGVMQISMLSHVNADADSRSEFYSQKAELESFTRSFRREAAEFSPIISVFRMPSNVMLPYSSSITRSSSRDRNNRDYDAAVPVKDVAVAMQIDAFEKASRKGPPGSRKKKPSLDTFNPKDVRRILADAEYNQSWLSPV